MFLNLVTDESESTPLPRTDVFKYSGTVRSLIPLSIVNDNTLLCGADVRLTLLL